MTHQNAQKVAPIGAKQLDRVATIRAALHDPAQLRTQAERLLAGVPAGCSDLLAWSPEGYSIALVASVLAKQAGRDVVAHHASLVTPLAPAARKTTWAWISVEESLGLGSTRHWAQAWATSRGGVPHDCSSSLAS
jgi:hypothetical protein